MTIRYIARYEGRVVGKRTSKDRTYTHAIVVHGHGKTPRVATWCGRPDLAQGEQRKWSRHGYTAEIVEAKVDGYTCAGKVFATLKDAKAHAEHLFKTTGVVAAIERG